MRSILSKVLTGSMIASAALMVSACGPKTDATDNTTVTDVNSTEGTDTMSDNMTAVDGGANGGMMANDSSMMGNGGDMMGNSGGMMGNDTMTTTNSTSTTSNAM